MNQEELVKRLQVKDIMAFERLYDMYHENVCGVVHTIVRDKTLAEELTQNVFATVWSDAHNYSPLKGPFFSWVLHIARKAAFDELGARSVENNENILSVDYLLGILNGKDEGHLLHDANGLKKLAKNVEKKNIEIFDLLYFKGYSQRKTSEVLGIPLSKVIQRNRNCILKIRGNMTFEWM
ncbi:sigma-70 family RNA polymerase sigma factor [Maribacter sp.]|nr:sigma-70 family RNA polymerase sigma factor [Maribacter sp.]